MTAIIAGYARTPFCKINGQLASFTAPQLGAHAIKAALERAGITADKVERVIGGQVVQAGVGQNPARQSAVHAGIPLGVPAITINSVCLSGAEAVAYATRLIDSGEADVVVAVGQESMSQTPHAWVGSRQGKKYGDVNLVDTLQLDALTDAFLKITMGAATEESTRKLGTTRQAQDQIAVDSHLRAEKFRSMVDEEIEPIGEITTDDGIRANSSLEALSKLKPAFASDGTITAANSSQLTDGAAAIILVSEKYAEAKGIQGIAKVLAHSIVAGPDYSLNHQPANAVKVAATKAGISVADLEVFELNEACAAVSVASAEALGVSNDRVNIHGGAIAIGHPVGASGARIVGHLARSLKPGQKGAVGICGGGGQGVGIILEALGGN
ncbi:MAG: acetyl-CoA C-acyltransferase [Micrococcales bacterium]